MLTGNGIEESAWGSDAGWIVDEGMDMGRCRSWLGLGEGAEGAEGAVLGGSKGGWWKDRTECGVDTVGETETETLGALSGGFSASSLRIITGAGGCRTTWS